MSLRLGKITPSTWKILCVCFVSFYESTLWMPRSFAIVAALLAYLSLLGIENAKNYLKVLRLLYYCIIKLNVVWVRLVAITVVYLTELRWDRKNDRLQRCSVSSALFTLVVIVCRKISFSFHPIIRRWETPRPFEPSERFSHLTSPTPKKTPYRALPLLVQFRPDDKNEATRTQFDSPLLFGLKRWNTFSLFVSWDTKIQ